MARWRVSCACLCLFSVLFPEISALSSQNDNYVYGLLGRASDNDWAELELLGGGGEGHHRLTRRDVVSGGGDSVAGGENRSIVDLGNGTGASRSSGNQSKVEDAVATKPRAESTTVIYMSNKTKPEEKLLGVNGTGQRRPPIPPLKQPKLNEAPPSTLPNAIVKNHSDEDEGLSIPVEMDGDIFNATLKANNVTQEKSDDHVYYNSTMYSDPELGQMYWVELSNRSDVKVNELLSKSHRRAATVQLSFNFPFYGHLIKNVTIATGGFLYTGDYVHSWLAATQYIAPLMANFDTSISNDSYIRYLDNGTAFTVEWERVVLQDKPNEGEFTFQTTLHQNGDIVFVYRNVPLFIRKIEDEHHPVKVGLSDAYIIDRTIFFVRRKTIYEYHRINFVKEDITNSTVIYLRALPTCLERKDCKSCVTTAIPHFECLWCPSSNKCSSGIDRNRQEWLVKNCDKKKTLDESMCDRPTSDDVTENNATTLHDSMEFETDRKSYEKMYNSAVALKPVKMGVSGIVAILFLVAVASGLVVWIMYAYRNPHTTSGQMLIRYRPSQWRWRRGEARYTAATIHM